MPVGREDAAARNGESIRFPRRFRPALNVPGPGAGASLRARAANTEPSIAPLAAAGTAVSTRFRSRFPGYCPVRPRVPCVERVAGSAGRRPVPPPACASVRDARCGSADVPARSRRLDDRDRVLRAFQRTHQLERMCLRAVAEKSSFVVRGFQGVRRVRVRGVPGFSRRACRRETGSDADRPAGPGPRTGDRRGHERAGRVAHVVGGCIPVFAAVRQWRDPQRTKQNKGIPSRPQSARIMGRIFSIAMLGRTGSSGPGSKTKFSARGARAPSTN